MVSGPDATAATETSAQTIRYHATRVVSPSGPINAAAIQEAFPDPRPAYTTVQTTVYRLEMKQAVRRVRKISNAHIFEPVVARDVARLRLLDEVLSFFGGRAQPMMAQLVEAGKLTRDDLRDLEKAIKQHEQRPKPGRSRK